MFLCILSLLKLYANNNENEWVLHTQKEGVNFYVKIDTCENGQQYFFVKIENTNIYKVDIKYKLNVTKNIIDGSKLGEIKMLATDNQIIGTCSIAKLSFPILFSNAILNDIIIYSEIFKNE